MPGTYISPAETKLYYCQSRYYDPAIGRWINADAFASTGQGLLGNNMFAYCNNNPIIFKDSSGEGLETAWDFYTFLRGIADVAENPDDPLAWLGLAGDVIDLVVPFLGGIGESIRAVTTTAKIVDTADDTSRFSS